MKRFPESWVICDFGQVVENADGARKPVSLAKREKIKGTYPYYGATGQIDSLNNYTHDGEYILIGEDGANLLSKSKKLAFVASGKFWVNNHAHAVKALAGMPSQFIEKFINSLDLMPFITGSAQPKLTKSNLEKIPFPLASLPEQKVIAEKLDSLLAQVESTKARLENIPGILKQFRQSVLAAAVSGELTEDWRENYDFNPRFRRIGDSGVEVKTGPFGSALHKSDYVAGGIPVINPMHISDGFLFPSNEMTISEEKFQKLSAWHLQIGDVIVGRRGEMGRAAVISSQEPLLCGTGSMIIRVSNEALPKYLELILRSPIAVSYFNAASVGSTMVNLNQKIIKDLEVYFPTLEEQEEIVRRVEELFGFADKVAAQVKTAMESVNHLTQSILAQAFSGELTKDWREQNPDLISGENSAAALLERIKAERAKLKPAPQPRELTKKATKS